MYQLIITKVIDRTKAAYFLRKLYPGMSAASVFDRFNNLPTAFTGWQEPELVNECLTNVVEFTYYEHIEFIEDKDVSQYYCRPPWEKKEYVDAKNWYFSLPKEDRDKIEILINLPKVGWA